MTLELAFNIAISLISVLMGWILRVVYDAQQKMAKDLHEIENRMNDSFVRMNDSYVKKDDFYYLVDGINARFDRLESRLEIYFTQKGPHQ